MGRIAATFLIAQQSFLLKTKGGLASYESFVLHDHPEFSQPVLGKSRSAKEASEAAEVAMRFKDRPVLAQLVRQTVTSFEEEARICMSLFSLRSCSCTAVGFRFAEAEGFVLVTVCDVCEAAGHHTHGRLTGPQLWRAFSRPDLP